MTDISKLQSIDPYEFEKLVAQVWGAMGYETKIRKKSGDKAIDVEATRGKEKVLIQAKRYSSTNKVGGPDVRKYATLYQQDPFADQVVIVTTSSFTSQAKEIGVEQNVRLINGQEFSQLLANHNLNPFDTKSKTKNKNKPVQLPAEFVRVQNFVFTGVLSLFLWAFLITILQMFFSYGPLHTEFWEYIGLGILWAYTHYWLFRTNFSRFGTVFYWLCWSLLLGWPTYQRLMG